MRIETKSEKRFSLLWIMLACDGRWNDDVTINDFSSTMQNFSVIASDKFGLRAGIPTPSFKSNIFVLG